MKAFSILMPHVSPNRRHSPPDPQAAARSFEPPDRRAAGRHGVTDLLA